MDRDKYELMKNLILESLKSDPEISHKSLLELVHASIRKKKIVFPGSVEWYMEWVKLDLESSNIIYRKEEKGKFKFRISE